MEEQAGERSMTDGNKGEDEILDYHPSHFRSSLWTPASSYEHEHQKIQPQAEATLN